ncbi:unnamed protein product [Symbiodinium microadriaticum]|nr:unnamed protein product [Symbiodinium sp. KB8]CAE7890739.1 unnamed protein product [Symbiodinium microadriaticum]
MTVFLYGFMPCFLTPVGVGKGRGNQVSPEVDAMQISGQGMSYTDNVEDRRFRESVHASLPQHALHHNRTKLVQSEWTCKVRAPEELSRQGGIALVPKSLVPQVLAAVGTTMQPVAMLTSQPAWELHLKGYSSSQVTCALQTVGEQGAVVYMESQRWLTQLGEGKPVTMEIDGLAVVDECITMAKMTFTFDTTIIVRENGCTATALVSKSHVDDVLRASGLHHVWCKLHADETERNFEVIYLPYGTTYKVAMDFVQSLKEKCFGAVKKTGGAEPRFGIRFLDEGAMQAFAQERGLEDQVKLGRYKLTEVSPHVGHNGLKQMMLSALKWQLYEVLYLAENYAVVSAAMNRRARDAFKAAKMEYRTADAEAEDQNTAMAIDSDNAAWHKKRGIHAVTETKADRMTQIRMDQELNALNEMNGPNKQVQVLWGEPVGETRSGGIALFLGPGAVGHAMRLTGGGPKAAAVDEWTQTLGDQMPTFIAGDFNAETSELPQCNRWEDLGSFFDAHRFANEHLGRPIGPTTQARRIDMIWMNEVALLSFADFATTWDFATHQSLHVQIGLQASQAELSFRADAWLQHKQSLQRPTDSFAFLALAKGVAGPCGWRHAELRKLPDSLLQQLIDIFMLMEQHGTTLSVNCQGDISLIPKKADCFDIDALRPITVLSYLHRMYAGARLRAGLLQWQEDVLGELPLRANRPGQRTHDLTLTAGVTLEHMRHQQQSISAVSYDLSKAFDSMPVHADNANGFGWMVLKRLGFDARVTAVMFDQYRRLQRRLRTLQHLGQPVTAAGQRGIVQGCAISMIFCNCITIVWAVLQRSGLRLPRALQLQVTSHSSWPCDQHFEHIAIELSQPDTTTLQGGYADDLHVISSSATLFKRAHVLTVLWAIVCDVQLNVRKTVVFGATVLYLGLVAI